MRYGDSKSMTCIEALLLGVVTPFCYHSWSEKSALMGTVEMRTHQNTGDPCHWVRSHCQIHHGNHHCKNKGPIR